MRVASILVRPDAIDAIVAFESDEPLRSSEIPGLVPAVLRSLPGLKGHHCDNGAGLSFAQEAADTELAHLIEHAALEIMALAGSPATLRGDTSWDFAADGRGVFHVRLGFDDDRVAIGALRCACGLVRVLARGEKPPDVEAEARRLRVLRDR